MQSDDDSLYERVGGDPVFEQLVEVFYRLVEADPDLRPMFPEELESGKRWQFLFLTQFFGGPARYAEERGHPRLRMRHMPFRIDKKAREHWLHHMLTAIDTVEIGEPERSQMRDYFERASAQMVNAEISGSDLPIWGPRPTDGTP